MLANPDWSRTRSVNGKQTMVNRPFAFPLNLAKVWVVDHAEITPSDRRQTREHLEMTYKLAAWEDATVPAGTFHALRIEDDGTGTAELPSNTMVAAGRTSGGGGNLAVTTRRANRTASGRFIKTFWYVPDARRWLKSEESFYDNNGERSEQETSVLDAYKVDAESH